MIRDKIIGEINNRIYINYSNHINASVQHLLTLINDILDLTKIEASQFDINETVNNVQDVFDSEQVHIKVWS
jgi:signal transduction histidine kinase